MLIFYLESCQQKSQEGKKENWYEELKEQRTRNIENRDPLTLRQRKRCN